MNIAQPVNGATLSLGQPISFSGQAGPTAVRVQLFADAILLADAPVVNGTWSATHVFSQAGLRTITLTGLDPAGAQVASTSIQITLVSPNRHTPPAGTEGHLAAILDLVGAGTQLQPPLQGLQFMSKLPGGQLYFESDLDLDTDGVTDPTIQYDLDHLPRTSIDRTGTVVDANVSPYFVLPGGFYAQFGIQIGDVAAVLYRDRIEFAIFADTGPRRKIGEGSIALHRSLGFERIKNHKVLNIGIDKDVVTLVFPGSGNGSYQDPDAIRAIGSAAFQALGGVNNSS